jgi:Mn-dependent DtxR family transcriptional regulator
VRVLKRLLSTIAAGRIANTAELAAAMDASPAMVEALVDELERRGLLQRAGDCGSVCTGCPTELACGQQGQASAWLLTAAGRRYAES